MHKNHALTKFWHGAAIRRARHFVSPRRWYRYLTADRRPLPGAIIAGAQKAGTTSLFGYLAGHPQCLRPLTKEVNYFDQNHFRGERWYRMHFPRGTMDERRRRRGQAAALGIDASPHYMFDSGVAARVRRLLPDAKAIFLLRNPVNRAYSHYHHEVRRGREHKAFEECIELEVEQQTEGGRTSQPLSYLTRGVYVDQLCNWRDHFPAEQMLIVEAERMFRSPREVLEQVLAFLGLDPWTPREFGNLNPGRYHTPLALAARQRAQRYFASHNERLFEFLGERYDWQ
jgi:hypothetical protein